MTQSALSESVASQTQRSPGQVRRCASRSASTTRTASPASTARRTFAGLDVEATQTAPSARSISCPNPQTSKDTLDIIFSSESFQICADGPLGSTRECEEGCNFNNDCPIEQVRSLKKWRVGMRRKEQGRVGASWASGRRLRGKDRQRIQSDGFKHHRIHRKPFSAASSYRNFHHQLHFVINMLTLLHLLYS